MCGIIGTTDQKISNSLFSEALEKISRRGPDNQGFLKKSTVFFGHSRLTIIDVDKRSNQPFTYKHKDNFITISYNGEIYNYEDIKYDLIVKGYSFSTSSDTEVICAAFLEYDIKCFDLFEGMWAIAIHDGDRCVITRDRVGKKPLYYSLDSSSNLSFSSSIESVALLSNQNEIDEYSIELYFALGFVPRDKSILKNILKVLPGQIIEYEIFSKKIKKDSFSKLNHKIVEDDSIKDLLLKSVNKRLISDVPITTLMSGGIDSTIVTSLVNKNRKKITSLFVDFNDEILSEKKWAAYLSTRNNIKLKTIKMHDNDLSNSFKEYYDAYEEPFADYSGIPSIAIFKKISNSYKVVLTGDGGDELFFGYPHYLKKYILFKFYKAFKLFSFLGLIPSKLKLFFEGDIENFESNYLKNHAIVTKKSSDYINFYFNNSLKNNNSLISSIIDYDRTFYNWPEKYLVKIDRASMFAGVEVRSPFLDEKLLIKIKSTSNFLLFTPFIKKLYLKLSYYEIFGFRYFFAKKKGFTPPIQTLRERYFVENDFIKLKEFLNLRSVNLHNEIINLNFDDLKKDKILFDRFFFFNEWIKNSFYSKYNEIS